MFKKYKLLIIILASALITYVIYIINLDNKINLVSIGDGISSGITPYNMDSLSFNDYLKDYLLDKKILKEYNNYFSKKDYTIAELLRDLEDNTIKNNKYILQIMHNADYIIISIGEDELTQKICSEAITREDYSSFLTNFNKLLSILNEISDATIIVLGLYENNYLDKSNIIILNTELNNMIDSYGNTFIDINSILNADNFLNNSSYYFNYLGHVEIFRNILSYIDI